MLPPPLRTALPSSTTPSPRSLRGSHPLWPCFPSGSPARATTPEGLPPGLLPVQSPLLRLSAFVSLLVLTDMLKSRTSSGTPCLFVLHVCDLLLASARARHRPESLVIPYRSAFSFLSSSLTGLAPATLSPVLFSLPIITHELGCLQYITVTISGGLPTHASILNPGPRAYPTRGAAMSQ